MRTILLVDSCSDLPLSYIEENSDIIDAVGMPVTIDGKGYVDDFGKTLTHEKFYGYLRNRTVPSTSQITAFTFLENFERHYKKDESVIYLSFASAMSGTYNNAVLAKNMLLEKYPDADVTIIDTLSASIGEGVIDIYAAKMLRCGKSKEEIIDWVEKNKLNSNHWFAVNDLYFLKKGGRISSTSAAVGTLLNVKPIITIDDSGKLKPYINVRGRKKSLNFIADKIREHIKNENDAIILIGHGDCIEDAKYIKSSIETSLHVKKIIITELSATIATHVGPDMIAAAFIGDKRENK